MRQLIPSETMKTPCRCAPEDSVDTGVSLSAGDELSPVIDSRVIPKEHGNRFNYIHQGTSPSFELVITYAKYRMQQGKKWKRMPRAIHLKSEDLKGSKTYFGIKDVQTGELETVAPTVNHIFTVQFALARC